MNLYDVLNIKSTASKEEIKMAYKKLALKYHPDKNKDKDAVQKFQEIKGAFEVLYDDQRREQYDHMDHLEQINVFELFKQYFTDVRPEYTYIYDGIINILYKGGEDEFKEDINQFNIKNIFERVQEKFTFKESNYIPVVDGCCSFDITIKERYNDLYKIEKIKNNDKCSQYMIPLFKEEYDLKDIDGNIIKIKLNYIDDCKFKKINEYDIICTKTVSLSQYLYGDSISIFDPNNNIVPLTFSSCLEQVPIFIIENKGLPYISDNGIVRGDLHVYLQIEGINSPTYTDIEKVYANTLKDTLNLMFPPLE